MIIVVDADSTTRAGAALLRDQLDQVGSNIIGGIYNNFDRSNAKYSPGSYQYYYSYKYVEKPNNGERKHRASGNGNGFKPAEERETIWYQ